MALTRGLGPIPVLWWLLSLLQLLLVFPIQLWVACVRSARSIRRRKVARMDGRAGSSSVVVPPRVIARPVVVPRTRLISATICAAIGWRGIRRTCRFSMNDGAVAKYSRPRCGSNRWLAHVHGSPLLRVGSRRVRMMSLNRDRRHMSLTRCSLFLRRWTPVDPAVAAVVADMVLVPVNYCRVVDVVNLSDVDVVHGTVIEKAVMVPTSTFITLTEIAEAVTDPAIEADHRTPIPIIENKPFAAPTPISWSPKETDFRSHHPCARHPIVIVEVVAVGPVDRGPYIAFARAKGLLIDRQRRRGEVNDDPHPDLCERCCRHAQQDEREQQSTNETDMHFDSSCLPSLVCPVLLCCCGLRGLRGEIAGLQRWRSTLKRLSCPEVDLTSRARQQSARLRQHREYCHRSSSSRSSPKQWHTTTLCNWKREHAAGQNCEIPSLLQHNLPQSLRVGRRATLSHVNSMCTVLYTVFYVVLHTAFYVAGTFHFFAGARYRERDVGAGL